MLRSKLDSPVTLSPDGKSYAFVRESGQESALFTADVRSGEEQKLIAHKLPQALDYPAWSPDGRIIAYAAGDSSTGNPRGSDSRILAWDVANRTERILSRQTWAFIRQLHWVDNGRGIVMSARDQELGMYHIWHVAYPSGTRARALASSERHGVG